MTANIKKSVIGITFGDILLGTEPGGVQHIVIPNGLTHLPVPLNSKRNLPLISGVKSQHFYVKNPPNYLRNEKFTINFYYLIFFMGYINVEILLIVHGAEWTIEMYKQHSFPN